MQSTDTDDRLQPAVRPTELAPNFDFGTDVVTIPVRLCNLPPFNAIASQVLALTTDPDLHLSEISKVIQGDPAFAADILFLANSSLFGFPARMHSLRHAIALLGLDRVTALAVTVAMRGFVGTRNPLVHQCWQHSVACALVCETISAAFGLSSDRAYTAGLMHDIGRLGLLKTYPKEMTPVLNGDYLDTQSVLQAEREALQVDHGRAGAFLIGNWTLPADFSEICQHHHDPANTGDSEILQVVKAGCKIADAIGFAAVKCQHQPSYRETTSLVSLPPIEKLHADVATRLAAFRR